MKKVKSNILFVFLFVTVACTSNLEMNKQNLDYKDSLTTPLVEDSAVINIPSIEWLDDSVSQYIKRSQMDLIVLDKKTNKQISWMIDKQERNERVYYAIKIGRDFEDRFVSDGWIFIDSASRQVYEYDLAEDSLIEFKD